MLGGFIFFIHSCVHYIVYPCLFLIRLLQPQTMFRQFVRHKRIEYNPPVRVHLQDGNARSSTAVLDRFMRLYNGLWIRPLVGRHRKLWKKSFRRQNRLRDHVFCTRRQCEMLDQMVTKEYKMRRYYPEDPYEPYQSKQHRPEDRYKPPPFLP